MAGFLTDMPVGSLRQKFMAKWKVYDGQKAPQCTKCGMWAPFARYSRKNGVNAREITDYCPNCGEKMTGLDECTDCPYSKSGEWQNNGICFSCRGHSWVFGTKQNFSIIQ